MADYIKVGVAFPGALQDIGKGRAQVWLYVNQAGEVVGYGSLGTTRSWRWPDDNSPKIVAHHIPNLAVEKRYFGKPAGPKDERYSAQIIDDLIDECRNVTDANIAPVVTLFVHPDNAAAFRVYERAGFARYSMFYTDPSSGVRYEGMLLSLGTPEPNEPDQLG